MSPSRRMLTFPLGRALEVMILGAGFSKALSESMPLTDALGDLVLAVVQANSDIPTTHRPFENGLFEAWLSRIAEDQPDLTTVKNLENRMLFQHCSQSLASVLEDCVEVALQDGLYDHTWLLDLLGTLHARRSTVITFNQDTLVEFAVGAADLYSWNQSAWRLDQPQPRISWSDVIDCQPPLPSGRYGFALPQPTLRLLKLHGSTNWYWTAGDESGATTACWFLPGTLAPEEAVPDEAAARRRELPGRVPLIVPPTAGKSTYYKTPLLTQLWQDARGALSRPTVRVGLVGYSIPPTDLVTSGMIRETLADRANLNSVFVDIVNPEPGPVRQNLQTLGIDPSRIAEVRSVPAFVVQYVARAAEELVDAFRQAQFGDARGLLLTGTDIEHSRKVVGFGSIADGELEVLIEDSEPPYTGPNISPSGKPPALGLRDLLARLEDASIRRLVVVTRENERRPIVGASDYVRNTGPGDGRWQVLCTARTVA